MKNSKVVKITFRPIYLLTNQIKVPRLPEVKSIKKWPQDKK